MSPASLELIRALAKRPGDVGAMARAVLAYELHGGHVCRLEAVDEAAATPARSPAAERMARLRAERAANNVANMPANTARTNGEQLANMSEQTANIGEQFANIAPPVDKTSSLSSLGNSYKNSTSEPDRLDARVGEQEPEQASRTRLANINSEQTGEHAALAIGPTVSNRTETPTDRRHRKDRDMAARAATESERLAKWNAANGGTK